MPRKGFKFTYAQRAKMSASHKGMRQTNASKIKISRTMARKITYRVTEGGCFECTSHKPASNGYPQVRIDGEKKTLHRFVYEISKGEIPDGLVVRHTCDNRKCMNPEHLILGTYQDNNWDAVLRQRARVGERSHMAKLTTHQVKEIFHTDRCEDAMKKYGISQTQFYRIKRGDCWRHLNLAQSRELEVGEVEK